MTSNATTMDKAGIVFATHVLVGLGMAGLGAYRFYQTGSVAAAGINVAIGAVIVFVGYRLRELV